MPGGTVSEVMVTALHIYVVWLAAAVAVCLIDIRSTFKTPHRKPAKLPRARARYK